MDYKTLIENAIEARKMAYVPYSKFAVGAALLSKDGEIFRGCNIENASFGGTNCAERTALFKAVSEGVRNFEAICVVGAKVDSDELDWCPPCGICRQVLREFCSLDMPVILAKNTEEYKVYTLEQMLPQSFGPENL